MRTAEATHGEGFKGSPVVGYMRSAERGDPRLDEWEAGLRQYAAEHGYNLVAVVRDEGVSAVLTWKPGLQRVLRDVERRRYAGVLVPSTRTLGQTPASAQRLRERIEQSGSWLEVLGLGD